MGVCGRGEGGRGGKGSGILRTGAIVPWTSCYSFSQCITQSLVQLETFATSRKRWRTVWVALEGFWNFALHRPDWGCHVLDNEIDRFRTVFEAV